MSALSSAGASTTDVVAQADTLLCADRQFGDSAAIGERNLARFRLGLTMLARHDGEGEKALRAAAAAADEHLRPLLYDPVLRNCFEVDLVRLESGRLGRSSFARLSGYAAGAAADAPSSTGPCEALTHPHRPAWPGRGDAWIMTEPAPRDSAQEILAGRLMELYRDALGDVRAAGPVDPTDDIRAVLREGAELLATLLPSAGAGVLGHVTMVGFTHRESEEGPLQSMSGGDPLPSTVLLAPERCTSPWLAAESLLHEGAHLKLFDALRTGALVANPNERVPIPWRIGRWTLIRVFVALHFYVHLLVFRAAAATAGDAVRERFGPPPSAEELDEPSPGTPAARSGEYRTSAERARYLAQCVLTLPDQALTENGHRFARWLLTVLRLVDDDAPQPPDRTAAKTRREDPSPVPGVPTEGVLQQAGPVDACALPGLGQLVVSTAGSARMHWLNARSWTVYSLCDGRDFGAVRTAYARAAGLPAGSEETGRQVGESLRRLLDAGLVTHGG
ncbi:HEXXH motif-containing putative peptide modification protein [Streptomyces sp. NPDC002018]|uniref:aKG-HExxH-type peptide beta-hydroxylase n=1 Tax=Streptomyces sp. NPDC002018 TaxID=3364629 RepID=UPI0036AA0B75